MSQIKESHSKDGRPPVILLMGPTASGKTDLAVALTKVLPVEIISVDSALVYRDMNIGTAKPDTSILAMAPHRLVDIRDPSEPYSAADFRQDALKAMTEIHASGRIPLLAGGTMLYFRALLEGLADLPAAQPDIRSSIEAEAAEKGWPELHRQLSEVDPETASQLHPNHSQRICRALEVYRATGTPLSRHKKQQQEVDFPWRPIQFAIAPSDRTILHKRIEKRFESMMKQGFLEEVEALYRRGDLDPEMPAIRAVGYRQTWEYLQSRDQGIGGNISRDDMVERAIIATRQLAKRQITWLRSWPELHWLTLDDGREIGELVVEVLEVLKGLGISK